MTITTVKAAIQAKNRALSTIRTAPTQPPPKLLRAHLPAVICIPGPCQWTRMNYGDMVQQRRSWRILGFVQAVDENRPVEAGAEEVDIVLEQVGQAYFADETLGDAVAIIHQNEIEDDGANVLEYAGEMFHGFELRVPMSEKG